MTEVQLVINGQKFPVHYRLLHAIAKYMPYSATYNELARALAHFGVPSIAKTVIETDSVDYHLFRQDLDEIWAAGTPDIRRSIVRNDVFCEGLTDAQARDILDAHDPDLFRALVYMTEQLDPAKTDGPGERLSREMADALLEHIISNRDLYARQALAEHVVPPLKFRPSFRECVKSGFWVGRAVAKMQPEELDILNTVPLETLQVIASNVEDIRDEAVQRSVIDLLSSHPDPSVRLALARNRHAPQAVLESLRTDDEPDVVLAARKSLGRDDDPTILFMKTEYAEFVPGKEEDPDEDDEGEDDA